MIWLHSVFKVTENVGVFLVTHALTHSITDVWILQGSVLGKEALSFLVWVDLGVFWLAEALWSFPAGVHCLCFRLWLLFFGFHTWLHRPFFALSSWVTFSRSLLVENMLDSASSSTQSIIPKCNSGQGVGTSSLSIAKSNKMGLFYSNRKKGLPRGLNGKESRQCRRHGFNPWVGQILWRRDRLPSPVFFSGECHGQRSLVGYSPWGCERVGCNLWLKEQQEEEN